MPELLLELFSEEIPARMQARAADDLKRLVTEGLKKEGLEFSEVKAFATPRRLALVIDGIPEKQADVSEEKRGPRTDAPKQAINGFLGSVGLTLDQVEQREMPKGTFYFAVIEKKGQATSDVLPGILLNAIKALPWAKSQRWGNSTFRWVRPLHSIIALFDGEVLEGGIEISNKEVSAETHADAPTHWKAMQVPLTIDFGDLTYGHRFLASPSISIQVKNFADYEAKLRNAHVMLDPAERRALIKEESDKLAAGEGLSVQEDTALLAEVAGLVEWPVVLMGQIDDEFMEVPPEVLTSSMAKHQKYFSLEDKDGKLAPRFVVVSNMVASDGGDAIRAGNERVLRARLYDAKFFWDQDRKQNLLSRVADLEDIVFHAKMGKLTAKVYRAERLLKHIVPQIEGAVIEDAHRANRLSKADLTTGMVAEFPDLQGVMGRYYALHDGEKPEVADAIAEHYSPLGPGDTCPSKPLSVAVALADKIDTLVGFFAIDEKPTGSKDPFALRRAALSVIRLIVENNLRLPLQDVFKAAHSHYEDLVTSDPDAVAGDVLSFFADRLKVHLKDKGVRHDLVSAVFALGGEDDLVRLLARVEALSNFLGTDDGANLLTAYKRAANILRIEEKKDDKEYAGVADSGALEQDEERALFDGLTAAEAEIATALKGENYESAMKILANLRAPVDKFFDEVTVNCNDSNLRVNRLLLLSQIRSALGGVADFSLIEG
ncbi:MAG: glycine--tRNA ligase subunit beta [Rhodospirillaceae bacterium]|jgi:glycyl-tRNA synthetase beta chain|nr:glycine--tRNA ligase subunit beta [Rhodospirillales bacterium]MBT3907054.1 glycine--tRNA ligase subunit beta [Rhodospirillaceae bacterium]MBT4700036.1 glycine--tRNA ligase subunit beta [Rhodospirillaceae bacterium]MBT5035070.1 glycine--tRNA ligase subunit beta [Rhodospirillaceae bacterium]MBT6222228.1 glycine--tRNA ligase subunit beta [Rhodospirillaceae bacterium]